jgi:hypothetical protein
VDLVKGPKTCQQRVVHILDVFIADSVDAKVVAECLLDKLIEQFAGFFESLDDRIGSKFKLVVDETLILIDQFDDLIELA